MSCAAIDIETGDGSCPATLALPPGGGPAPAVLMLMDGVGYRPALQSMAGQLAATGVVVLLPNLFYRVDEGALPRGAARLLPENRPLLSQLVQALTPDVVVRDIAAFLRFLDRHPAVQAGSRCGVVGYCMGGSMAVRAAAAFADRVAFAASFHGGRLVQDLPNSPHRLVGDIRAELYFGHADQDASMPAEAIATLEAALRASGLRFQSETYAGARHGFTMNDLPVYDRAACERHWQRLAGLCRRLH